MTFEMEVTGEVVNIDYKYDLDRGRTLLKTPVFDDPGFVRVDIETDYESAPLSGQHVVVNFRDSDGRQTLARFDDIRDIPNFATFVGSIERGETKSGSVNIPLEEDDILGQYDRGEYEDLAPGRVEVEVVIEDRFGNGTIKKGPATGAFNLGITDDALVKENTTITDMIVEATETGTAVQPQTQFHTKADHGVDLPLRVVASVGDEQVIEQDLETTITGSAATWVRLPKFELDGIPYKSNQLTYRVEGRSWAEGWVKPETEELTVENISVNDVTITGCRVTPKQVVAGDQVTVRSSVRNPLPVGVGVEGRVDFGGAQSTFARQIGSGEVASVTETFRTEEPGTAEPTIRLTSVGGNV